MKNFDGIFFRVQRDGKWQNICLSDLTQAERDTVLSRWDRDALKRCIDHLCECIQEIEIDSIVRCKDCKYVDECLTDLNGYGHKDSH